MLLRAAIPVMRARIVVPFVARKIRRRSPAFSDAHKAGLAIRVVVERSTRIRMDSTAKRNARMALALWQRRKTKWAIWQTRRWRRISRALRIRFILHVFSISLFATSKRNMRINQGILSLLRFHGQSLRESSAQWIGSFFCGIHQDMRPRSRTHRHNREWLPSSNRRFSAATSRSPTASDVPCPSRALEWRTLATSSRAMASAR
jgi:hypothetical protein